MPKSISDDEDAASEAFRRRMTWDDEQGWPVVTPPSQCQTCRHRRFDADGITCDAFTIQIPIPILAGQFDHTEPYPGDGGVRYEPSGSIG